MSDWVPIIGTLAGTLLGGILGYLANLLESKRKEKREKRSFFLEKLEETYKVTESIKHAYKATYAEMGPELLFPDIKLDKLDADKKVAIDRLKMLARFYSPSLLRFVELLEKSREQFGKTLATCYSSLSRTSESGTRLFKEITTNYQQIEDACDKLMVEISKLAFEYIESQ